MLLISASSTNASGTSREWGVSYLRFGPERCCAWGCELMGIMLPAGSGTCCCAGALEPYSRLAGDPLDPPGNSPWEGATCCRLPALACCCTPCACMCCCWRCRNISDCRRNHNFTGSRLPSARARCTISGGMCAMRYCWKALSSALTLLLRLGCCCPGGPTWAGWAGAVGALPVRSSRLGACCATLRLGLALRALSDACAWAFAAGWRMRGLGPFTPGRGAAARGLGF